jgi:biopolymer transport protein TolQ
MNPAEVASSPLAAPLAEITIWSMFWGAHIVVKCVIIGLLCASIWSVMVIIDKSLLIRRTRRTMDRFDEAFWSGNSLDELYNKVSERPTSGTASLFVAAMREWKRSVQNPNASFMGLHSRIDKVLDVSIGREVEKLESSLLVLATVASASPFVGLFGTVWGIMTSFRSIAASKNTSLAVVAPGIAEALFATAVGLVAAIPALIFYNKLQGDVSKAQARLETFADEFSAILSRQIDQTTGRDRAA